MRTLHPLARSALYGASFLAVFLWAVFTPVGQEVDAVSLGAFGRLRAYPWATVYGAREWLPVGLVILAGAVVVVGLFQRRYRATLRGAALLAIVYTVSFALKADLVQRPYFGDWGYRENTFPSGHVAMALAAVVAMLWIMPSWCGAPVVAAALLIVTFVAVASVLSFAHRASDVVGGILLVGAAAAGLAIGRGARQPPPPSSTRMGRVSLIVVAGTLVAAVVVVVTYRASRTGAAVDAIGLVALAAVVGLTTLVIVSETPAATPRNRTPVSQRTRDRL